MVNDVYVYRHRRLDNFQVFYIGIGKLKDYKRAYQSNKSRNKYWKNIANKTEYIIEIISDNLTWKEACELECLLIQEYGRKDNNTGILCNMTDGGDGVINMSQEVKDIISSKLINRTVSEDIINKRSKTQKELWNSDEYSEKRYIQSERAKYYHSLGIISRKGQSSKKKGSIMSEKSKEKISNSLKEYYKIHKNSNYKILDQSLINDIYNDYDNEITVYRLSKKYNLSRNLICRLLKERIMKISNEGISLIILFEGLKLKAYKCPAGIWTIGAGNTFYPNGKKVNKGDVITEEYALELLQTILKQFEDIVNSKIKVKLNQNQFDALVSHTYNTGGSDTLFKLINNKASDKDIRTWFETKYITADGVKLNGLIRRRKAEANLYFKV